MKVKNNFCLAAADEAPRSWHDALPWRDARQTRSKQSGEHGKSICLPLSLLVPRPRGSQFGAGDSVALDINREASLSLVANGNAEMFAQFSALIEAKLTPTRRVASSANFAAQASGRLEGIRKVFRPREFVTGKYPLARKSPSRAAPRVLSIIFASESIFPARRLRPRRTRPSGLSRATNTKVASTQRWLTGLSVSFFADARLSRSSSSSARLAPFGSSNFSLFASPSPPNSRLNPVDELRTRKQPRAANFLAHRQSRGRLIRTKTKVLAAWAEENSQLQQVRGARKDSRRRVNKSNASRR